MATSLRTVATLAVGSSMQVFGSCTGAQLPGWARASNRIKERTAPSVLLRLPCLNSHAEMGLVAETHRVPAACVQVSRYEGGNASLERHSPVVGPTYRRAKHVCQLA